LAPILDYMRGRAFTLEAGVRLGPPATASGGAHPQAAVIGRFRDQPALIAAAAVGPVDAIPPSLDNHAPILLSVKFIQSKLLADIAAQLRLTHLRAIGPAPAPAGDTALTLSDAHNRLIARFAWTPK